MPICLRHIPFNKFNTSYEREIFEKQTKFWKWICLVCYILINKCHQLSGVIVSFRDCVAPRFLFNDDYSQTRPPSIPQTVFVNAIFHILLYNCSGQTRCFANNLKLHTTFYYKVSLLNGICGCVCTITRSYCLIHALNMIISDSNFYNSEYMKKNSLTLLFSKVNLISNFKPCTLIGIN